MKKTFILIMMCLLGLFSLKAQTRAELVIGESGGYEEYYSPFAFYYNYSYSQQIYTAAEMNEGEPGFITSISFKYNAFSEFARNITIYMQNTDKAYFADNNDWVTVSSSDVVFDGEVYFPYTAYQWVTITLNTPFKYTGENLLVCVDDNTGVWKASTPFVHYATGEENARAISICNDNFNFGPDNVTTYGGANTYYTNPQVKFEIVDKVLPIGVEPEFVDLGYCANGAWKETEEFTVLAKSDALNITAIESTSEYFKLSDVELPYELSKENPLVVEVSHGESDADGEVTSEVKISYNDTIHTVQLRAYAYEPEATDVFELAGAIETGEFSVTPDFNAIYNNYRLPGSSEDGKDVVYKLTLEEELLVTASVTGANGKVVMYTSDFNGEEGPMADNNFAPKGSIYTDSSLEIITPAGEYYIVASATEEFTLNVTYGAIPAPGKATITYPYADQTNVYLPMQMSWDFATYTSEYQLLLDTQNPPVAVAVDWTDNLATSYMAEDLFFATTYYAQVNVRNESGVTEGDVVTFSTMLGSPSGVVITPDTIYEGETATVTWNKIDNATGLLGYNVYVEFVKVNDEPLTDTSYVMEGYTYNMDYGYLANISAVYELGESGQSYDQAILYVTAETQVSGVITEQDGVTPIAGVSVTLDGEDEAGVARTYTFVTDENGAYSGKVYAGSYLATIAAEGYNTVEKNVVAAYDATELNFSLFEEYYSVKWVNAVASEEAVDVTWSMDFSDAEMEDFEMGVLTTRDWNNSEQHPWVITETAYEGSYAIKSTGEGLDKAVSSIEIAVNAPTSGIMSFYHKIGSEEDYDLGKFYIDGELQSSISGKKDWSYAEFFISEGAHTYRWEYAKDSLTNKYEDAYFVDNITFSKEYEGGWIGYDNGQYYTTIGLAAPAPVYWGISFPFTESYKDFSLTKISVFDLEAANFTANIYLGGELAPGTLVSTQEFSTSGSEQMIEVELSTPVALDGTQPLWITLYCDELAYPAIGCTYVNNPFSDWISLDGVTWEHGEADYQLGCSWILRGFIEDAEGKLRVLTSKDANPTFEGGVSTSANFASRVLETPVYVGFPTSETTSTVQSDRAFTSTYNLYKKNVLSQEVELLAERTSETSYTDNSWKDLDFGAYQWGVSALYAGNRAPKVIYEESFENGALPEGWTVYNEDISGYGSDPSDDQNWTVAQSYSGITPADGNYFAYSPSYYYANIERFYLVTTPMEVKPGAVLNFNYINPMNNYYYSKVAFAVSESPTGPWTDLWATEDYSYTTAWTDAQVDLSEYAGQTLYFAFIHQFGWAYGGICGAVDNITISAESPESDLVWSKTVDKNMTTKVSVAATIESGDPITGTKVSFVNLNEEGYDYSVTLSADGKYEFDNFRKGVYELTVEKEGFNPDVAPGTVVEIWDETSYEFELLEDLAPVKNLYVSPTGWVMWDGKVVGAGEEFTFDFENGMEGWTTIDADNDGATWYHSGGILEEGSGHDSKFCMLSQSYDNTIGVLYPDNYLVTERAYAIGNDSQLRFWVCAQDGAYAAEHYGVAVSLDGNTSASGFTTIWEETLSAKSGSKATRGTLEQGAWYEKVVDLSDYAGQSVYIAIRHFNCSDMFFLDVDDISLVNASKGNRALLGYNIFSDGDYAAENLTVPYFQLENLVNGTNYSTIVTPVYTSGEGEDAVYTWKKAACENFEGVTEFAAEVIDDATVLTWSLPETATEDEEETREGEWIGYDDGTNVEELGLSYDGVVWEQFKWAIMFPAADMAEYAGQYITKVSTFDSEVYDGELFIYKGGDAEPGELVHSQAYSCSDINAYKEIALTSAVEISGTENIWIVLSNLNGQRTASVCADQGDANGRWLYFDGYGWLDNVNVVMPSYTWQINAFVSETADVPSADILGVMLYRNNELIGNLVQGETYTDKVAVEGDEYSIRVVYGGDKDVTYYAMSCPQTVESIYNMPCAAPKDLYGFSTAYADGTFGTMLGWPYVPPTSEWLYYDNGEFVDALGGPASFYWGIKFPVDMLESYAGTEITKVSLFDYKRQTGTINIYYGGETAPGVLVHSQQFETTGSNLYVEFELSYPLPIEGSESVWVVLGTNNGADFPAAMSAANVKDARWISLDGNTWEDIADSGFDGSWMIRAFVTNEAKGAAMPIEPIEFVNTATGGTLLADPNPAKAPTLKNYNIYRGTSLDNLEMIAETTEKSYFDEVEKGTYYYQVTAVYEENGEVCESPAANSYENPEQNYVVVEVTAIDENGINGMMVYPNPTDDVLNITVESMERITITNTLGQVVYDKEVSSDSEIINMSQYEAGVYMVRITTETGVAVKRITVI